MFRLVVSVATIYGALGSPLDITDPDGSTDSFTYSAYDVLRTL